MDQGLKTAEIRLGCHIRHHEKKYSIDGRRKVPGIGCRGMKQLLIMMPYLNISKSIKAIL